MSINNFSPHVCHENLLEKAPLMLSYKEGEDYATWREKVGDKLKELLGMTMLEKVDLNIRVEYEKEHETYIERRFIFTSEAYADVPCHLLIPKNGTAPFPLVICLQGHSSGMHISLGKPKFDKDQESIKGDRDFGLQAVNEGYAALILEQRCFGEREDGRPAENRSFSNRCLHSSMTALLLGRTMIGERVWDVSRAIDAVSTFPEIDTERIGCMGNSGGGTVTYYAACLDDRIRIAMPSCSVCEYRYSIAKIDHCADNYIPNILKYFEMGDLACLIAPRPLIIVAGREDDIFPIEGVEKSYSTIQKIYKAAKAEGQCRLFVGEGGHRFYRQAWSVFRELSMWK